VAREAFFIARAVVLSIQHLAVAICDLPSEILTLQFKTARPSSDCVLIHLLAPRSSSPASFTLLRDRYGKEVLHALLALSVHDRLLILNFRLTFV